MESQSSKCSREDVKRDRLISDQLIKNTDVGMQMGETKIVIASANPSYLDDLDGVCHCTFSMEEMCRACLTSTYV